MTIYFLNELDVVSMNIFIRNLTSFFYRLMFNFYVLAPRMFPVYDFVIGLIWDGYFQLSVASINMINKKHKFNNYFILKDY